MRKALAAAALLLASAPAAAEPRGHLDLYYVPSAKAESRAPGPATAEVDGDGYGVKGIAPLSENAFFTAEYQTVEYDGGDEVSQTRVGAGVMGDRGGGAILEYISLEDGPKADGLGVHLRLGSPRFYGQVGYLSLNTTFEDYTGIEYAVGIVLAGRDGNGLFADLRHTELEGQETSIELERTDIRAGLRMKFGGSRRDDY